MTLYLSSCAITSLVAAAVDAGAAAPATGPAASVSVDLTSVFALLATLSIATQKLVDIVKAWYPKGGLDAPDANIPADPKAEEKRQRKVQLIAGICGVATAGLAYPVIDSVPLCHAMMNTNYGDVLNFLVKVALVVILGLLASGASGPWNDLSTWLKNMKENSKSDPAATKTPTPAAGPPMTGQPRRMTGRGRAR